MDEKKDICRFCLKYEGDTFSLLDASSKVKLKVVVPELALVDATATVICSKCKHLLEESFMLKNVAFETNRFIRTQIEKLNIIDKVNLNYIVYKSSSNGSNFESLNICRICLNNEGHFMSINKDKTTDLSSSRLNRCLSELVADLTAEPVICEICYYKVHDMFSFKMRCLSVEEKVNRYLLTAPETEFDLNKLLTFSLGESSKSIESDNELLTIDTSNLSNKKRKMLMKRLRRTSKKKLDTKKKCYTCRQYGHISRECWETFNTVSNTAETDGAKTATPNISKLNQKPIPRSRPRKQCIHCGKMGHGKQLCPKRPKLGIIPAPKPQPQNVTSQQDPPYHLLIKEKPGEVLANPEGLIGNATAREHVQSDEG